MNIYFIINFFIFLYILISNFYYNIYIININLILIPFLLLKWIFNYRKCFFSYIECKIRKINKKYGYINNFCQYYGDLIYSKYNDKLFLFLIISYIIHIFNFFKIYYKTII